MKILFILAAILLTIPAYARPTTPCDERPEGCRHGVTQEPEARDSGGAGEEGTDERPGDERPTDGRDSGGAGRDSGGGQIDPP